MSVSYAISRPIIDCGLSLVLSCCYCVLGMFETGTKVSVLSLSFPLFGAMGANFEVIR